MWHGIAALATGKFIGDIGAAVDDYVSSVPGKPLGILEDYVGHGIGSEMHMAPDVLNYRTNHPRRLKSPGLCLAIEPCSCAAVLKPRSWRTMDRCDHGRQALLPVGSTPWRSMTRASGCSQRPTAAREHLVPLGVAPVPDSVSQARRRG